ncbi:MAG: hypothetical protein ACLVFV_07920, partial [Clostridium sp.]
ITGAALVVDGGGIA